MSNDVSRRAFLQQSALAMGGTALWQPWPGPAAASATVALVVSPDDRVAAAPPVRWAVGALRQALEGRGVAVTMATAVDAAPAESLPVLLAGFETPAVAAIADRAGVRPAREAEALAILPGERQGRPVLVAAGHDARGLMYAALELADRVEHAVDPLRALKGAAPLVEAPAQRRPGHWPTVRERRRRQAVVLLRSGPNTSPCSRASASTASTSAWDSATTRFAGSPRTSALPLSVPRGRARDDVRAVSLPDAERDRNLESLRSSAAKRAHGIDFQLGMWTHGYPGPTARRRTTHRRARRRTTRPTAATRSPRCCAPARRLRRDAAHALRERRQGRELRVLEDDLRRRAASGRRSRWSSRQGSRPEDGGRRALDRHARQAVRQVLGRAHGLPYQQTAIRELELPKADRPRSLLGAQLRIEEPHAVRLRGLPARRSSVRVHVPGVPGHAQVPALGRSPHRRRTCARLPVLRQRGRGTARAARLQGRRGLGYRGRPLRVSRIGC